MRSAPHRLFVGVLSGLLLLGPGIVGLGAAARAGPDPTTDPAQILAGRLRKILERPGLRGARVGALVVRGSDGSVVFDHAADESFVPASNAKILTAIAVLSSFGPTHRFETPVFAKAKPDGKGVIRGLAVRGVGDPALNSEDWWMLASELRRRGVERVEGDLVMDDGAFDGVRWNPGWGVVSSRAYHAPVGALTANYGAFSVTVFAGAREGDPVRVVIDPPIPYLALQNRAQTGAARSRASLVVDRVDADDHEKVVVSGSVRAGDKPRIFYRSVLDPTRYAGAVLAMQLRSVGIDFTGKVRVGGVPEGGVELLAFEGRPLREIVRLFVKYSNNAVAETLVKALGVREGGGVGSWSSGLSALEQRLLELGLRPGDFQLEDGSGLSYRDRVTPRGLVRALEIARDSFDFGPELVSALPIAALDGTLEKRAANSLGEVRAKTGLLNGITSLSGFARTRRLGSGEDEVLVFSILVNGYKAGDDAAMRSVDAFAAELVGAGQGR